MAKVLVLYYSSYGHIERMALAAVDTQGYDLILGDGVLFATGAVDVTAQVLQRLEKPGPAPATPAPTTPPPAPTPQSH